MAHEIDFSNRRANIAYIGSKPWHGLGQELTEGSPLEVWKIEAGFDWEALELPVWYNVPGTERFEKIRDKKVLVRSDTNSVLATVGEGYHPVQPGEVLEFYRDLVGQQGFELETAGCLHGGRRVWALAKTNMQLNLGGRDLLNNYLLLATSFDGSMATVASWTSVRVVCQNTMSMAVGRDGSAGDIRIRHKSKFDAHQVKVDLGLAEAAWDDFGRKAREMAKRTVTREEAVRYFLDLTHPVEEGSEENAIAAANLDIIGTKMNRMLQVYEGGVGQDTESARGTAWGLVNAVTRWADHERTARSTDTRLESAWFGPANRTKGDAWNLALDLVA